jgi:hypothetical protein
LWAEPTAAAAHAPPPLLPAGPCAAVPCLTDRMPPPPRPRDCHRPDPHASCLDHPPPVLPLTTRQGPNFFCHLHSFPLYLGARNRRRHVDSPPPSTGRLGRGLTSLAPPRGIPVTSHCFQSLESTTLTPSMRHRRSSLGPSSCPHGTPPFSEVLGVELPCTV